MWHRPQPLVLGLLALLGWASLATGSDGLVDSMGGLMPAEEPMPSSARGAVREPVHSRNGFSGAQAAEEGFSLRADGASHSSVVVGADTPFLYYDVALKSDQGVALGYSVGAEAGILALGWQGQGLVSEDGRLGPFFYTRNAGTKEPYVPGQNKPFSAVSQDIACLYNTPFISCYYHNVQRETSGVNPNITDLWPAAPTPSVDACAGGCEVVSMSLWRRAAAIVFRKTSDLSYHVGTFFLRLSPVIAWECTSGCGNSSQAPGAAESEPRAYAAVGLWENVVVLGSPARREVQVWVGSKDPARQGLNNLQPTEAQLRDAPYALHQRWTKAETLRGADLGGLNLFGAELSLKAKYLVVGAPGTLDNFGAISVHRVVQGDAGASVQRVCVVRGGGGTEFGFALDQAAQDGEDFIVAGAPRENSGYVVRVDPVRGCVVENRLIHSTNSQGTQDRVGAAVAMDGGFVWLGAPDYHRPTASGGPINGLLYVYAYCSSWSRLTDTALPPFQGYQVYLTECARCPANQWAPGARTPTCSSCLPERVGVDYGSCNYTCAEGYFGQGCEPCPAYAAAAVAMSKPSNSSWLDGQAECTWRCDARFEPARGGGACVPCATGDAAAEAAKEYVPGQCEWVCAEGFFNATAGPKPECVVCSEIMAQLGTPKPAHTSWFDGAAECVWTADAGFSCSRKTGACEACPPKPANAEWQPVTSKPWLEQCGYVCADNFYGHPVLAPGVCVTCSDLLTEVLAPEARPPLPDHAFWLDEVGYCGSSSWMCVDGYAKSAGGGQCCPAEVPANAIYHPGGAPCPFLCNGGYSPNAAGTACEPCANMPNGSEWLEGSGACVWVPVQGYTCSGGTCGPCPPKPEHSSWANIPLTTSTMARCDFVCKAGYYGHAVWAPGVCITCSKLFTEVLGPEQRPSLPANGVWRDDAGTCGANSWGCVEGFERSDDPNNRICCPPEIPNSITDETSLACGVRCELGYRWKDGQAACEQCPAKPDKAEWAADGAACTWKCLAGLHGAGQGLCLACADYMAFLGTPLPQGAQWPSGKEDTCTASSWTCAGGVKALNADPPGCCPLSVAHATSGGADATCGFTCEIGFSWDKASRSCKYCDDAGPVDPPPHSFWNGTRCAHQCAEPYWPNPEFPAKPTDCLTCQQRATWLSWPMPQNAEWIPNVASWDACKPDTAWRCREWGAEPGGYVRNGPTGQLCCSKADVVVPIDAPYLDGGWADGVCAWECRPGLFPRKPEPKAWTVKNISCLECGRYLAYHGISLCPWNQCADREYITKAEACSTEVTGSLQLDGIPQVDLEPAHMTAIRRAVAQRVGAGDADIRVTYISARARRDYHHIEASSVEVLSGGVEHGAALVAGAGAAHLTAGKGVQAAGGAGSAHLNAVGIAITLTVGGIDPAAATGVKNTLIALVNSGGLTQALRADNLAGSVWIASGGFTVGAASSAWQCKTPRRLNPATGVCCPLGTTGPDLQIPAERVMWAVDGCNIQQCNKGFHLFGGSCLTCAERNPRLPEPRFLPADAEWVEGETTCGLWKCKEGFVPSVSGYSCVSLTILRSSCQKHTRCGTCLAEEHCVWCPGNQGVPGISSEGACTPGLEMRPTSEYGCPYTLEGRLSAACLCEANRCKRECQHSSCDACANDPLCGWCGSEEKCMQGSLQSPKFEMCTADWVPSGSCSTDWGVWIIGLVCAGVSSSLVAMMCCYICVRIQRASELAAQGRQAPSADDIQRLLRSLHAFTYKSIAFGAATPGPSAVGSPGGQTETSEEEDRCCCICLGGYSDGDELRMLPCFHVYHAPCVDQWLSVSLECPLCKTGVTAQQGNTDRLVRAERCFLSGGNPHEQMHALGAPEPSPERNSTAGWGAFGSLFSSNDGGGGDAGSEEVRRIGWGRMTRGRRHAPLRAEHQRRQQESERAAGGAARGPQGAFSAGVALQVLPPSVEPQASVAPVYQIHPQPLLQQQQQQQQQPAERQPPNPQLYALASAGSFTRAHSVGSQRSARSSGCSSPSSASSSTLVYSNQNLHTVPVMPPPPPAPPSNPARPGGQAPRTRSFRTPISPSSIRPFDESTPMDPPPPYSDHPPPYLVQPSLLPAPRVSPPPSAPNSGHSVPVPADYPPPRLAATEAARSVFIPPGQSVDASDLSPPLDSRAILGPVLLSPQSSDAPAGDRAARSSVKKSKKKAKQPRASAHLELSPGTTSASADVSVYVNAPPAARGARPDHLDRRPPPPGGVRVPQEQQAMSASMSRSVDLPSARSASPSDSRVVGL